MSRTVLSTKTRTSSMLAMAVGAPGESFRRRLSRNSCAHGVVHVSLVGQPAVAHQSQWGIGSRQFVRCVTGSQVTDQVHLQNQFLERDSTL